jgi:hypothetical protein
MLVGGAEVHINQLLAGIPNTHMVVAGPEGLAAQKARTLAGKYTVAKEPRLSTIVNAVRNAEIVHIHTVNNEPILPLAVQLAGPKRIVQTIHNTFEAKYCRFVDHSFLIGVDDSEWIETPGLSSPIGEGVFVQDTLNPFTPWYRANRPIRLVEVRRPDKPMAWTLEDLLSTGVLNGLDWEASIVGIDGKSNDPRIQRLGELACPDEIISQADFLIHGTAMETFGRTVYEAMAVGTIPLATPIPAFSKRLREGEHVFLAKDMHLQSAAIRLKEMIQSIQSQHEFYDQTRINNHSFIKANASHESMNRAYLRGYESVLKRPPAPRSFFPGDVTGEDLDRLGTLLHHAVSGLPVAQHDVALLSEGARGIALWLIADQKLVSVEQRLSMLSESVEILGPRPAICLSLATAAQEANQEELAAECFGLVTQQHPYIVTAWLNRADTSIQKGDLSSAQAEFEGLLRFSPHHTIAKSALAQIQRLTRAQVNQPR